MTTIVTAADSDTAQVADVLAAAFTHDPVFGWLLPRTATRTAALRRMFIIEASSIVLPHGETRIARVGADTVGAALVLPPGHWRTPMTVQFRDALTYLRIFGRRIPRAAGLLNALERVHPPEPHYYLPYIGVHPDHHNRGIGTALLTPIIDQARGEGLPVYLEASSADSARLYGRLGFRTLSTIRPLGSPPLELMLHRASRAGQ